MRQKSGRTTLKNGLFLTILWKLLVSFIMTLPKYKKDPLWILLPPSLYENDANMPLV